MNRKWLLPLMALIVITLLTGGTDAVDVNRMIFVTGVGIDVREDDYLYTFYTAVPTGADVAISENNVTYNAMTIAAPSLAAAVRELETGSARDISFEHLSCTALGRSARDIDLSAAADFLLRTPAVRRQSVVFLLDSAAEEFFGLPFSGNIAASAAYSLEQLDDSDNRSSIMTLGRLAVSTSGYTLYVLGVDMPQEEVSGTDISAPGTIGLRGMAVYGANGLGGTLNREDAELARLFTHGQASGLITAADENGTDHYFEITYSDCKSSFEPGSPCSAEIDITVRCMHIDNGGSSDSSPDSSVLTEELTGRLNKLIDLSRKYGAALTGLDNEARQSNMQWYNSIADQWDSIYRTTRIELNVDCSTRQRDSRI